MKTFAIGTLPDGYNGHIAHVEFALNAAGEIVAVHNHGSFRLGLPVAKDASEALHLLKTHPSSRAQNVALKPFVNDADRQRSIEITKKRTAELVQSLGIADQVAGLSCAETLTDIAIRLRRLASPRAAQMSTVALSLATTARELGV